MVLRPKELKTHYKLTAVFLMLYGALMSSVWFVMVMDISRQAVLLVQPYVYLGSAFSPLSVGIAMILAGLGLLSGRRFGFILTAYVLTVWVLLSVVALFLAPMNHVLTALINVGVFGAGMYHFVQNRQIFMQDLPEIIQAISFLMFLGGWLGLSHAINHILYTPTLQITLLLGGSLLVWEGSAGLAAKSRIGLWFSMAVLLTAVLFDSMFLLTEGGSHYLYRLTLSAVAVYYLRSHQDAFYND